MGWIFDAAILLGEGAVMGMAEEQNANKKLVVCRSCHAEAERNNAYCSMCGSHELVRKDKFLKELENKAQAEKVLEKEFKRMSFAFAELQALERGMHCSSCIRDYTENARFCSGCGAALVAVQQEHIEALLLAKHPWLAKNRLELRERKSQWEALTADQEKQNAERQEESSQLVKSIAKRVAKVSIRGVGKGLSFLGKTIDQTIK
jgi:ribosomal protein L40E